MVRGRFSDRWAVIGAGVAWGMLLAGAFALTVGGAQAAGYRTANFIVEAPSEALAQKIGDAAEQYRHTHLSTFNCC